MSETLDSLELELRRIPGVVAVGLEMTGQGLGVRVAVARGADSEEIGRRAEMLALAHDERPRVAVTCPYQMVIDQSGELAS